MKTLSFFQCDAFTGTMFGGNPAGVVPEAKGLQESMMQMIAREMNLSETAFILPPTLKRADVQIRWFTPTCEVPLCGHATIGSFHILAEQKMLGMKTPGTYKFRVQTKSGMLGIVVEKKYSGSLIEFQIPIPRFKVVRGNLSGILTALGLRNSDLLTELPVVSNHYLYVPVRRLKMLMSLLPDWTSLRTESLRRRLLGVSVFSLETLEESSAFHSRFFAPSSGIDEDPVTGSANGPIGAYLVSFALPRGQVLPSMVISDGRLELIGEQGDAINRKGRVKVRIATGQKGPRSLAIAGEAVTILKAEIRI